jgi:GNAT superfamily N-acetyltransferase
VTKILRTWHEEPVAKHHDRQSFDCGQPELNQFLLRYARQSHERGAAKTFLAIDDQTNAVLGFYSLSPASVAFAKTPEVARRGLGRYEIGAFRLLRLATHLSVQGRGLGSQLLLAAGRRCLAVSEQIGGTVLLIDAKDSRAANWYAEFGALQLLDSSLTLILPLSLIAKALQSASLPEG